MHKPEHRIGINCCCSVYVYIYFFFLFRQFIALSGNNFEFHLPLQTIIPFAFTVCFYCLLFFFFFFSCNNICRVSHNVYIFLFTLYCLAEKNRCTSIVIYHLTCLFVCQQIFLFYFALVFFATFLFGIKLFGVFFLYIEITFCFSERSHSFILFHQFFFLLTNLYLFLLEYLYKLFNFCFNRKTIQN